MSVTIETPEGTRYITATLVLCSEMDVLEWAEEQGAVAYYLPNEADATTIYADAYGDGSILRLSAVARVTR